MAGDKLWEGFLVLFLIHESSTL